MSFGIAVNRAVDKRGKVGKLPKSKDYRGHYFGKKHVFVFTFYTNKRIMEILAF